MHLYSRWYAPAFRCANTILTNLSCYADVVPRVGRNARAMGDADVVPRVRGNARAMGDADVVPRVRGNARAMRQADVVPRVRGNARAMGEQRHIRRRQEKTTNCCAGTMHEVPGEGRGKQNKNRDKRELAGKKLTHVNGSPIGSKDFTASAPKTGQAQRG